MDFFCVVGDVGNFLFFSFLLFFELSESGMVNAMALCAYHATNGEDRTEALARGRGPWHRYGDSFWSTRTMTHPGTKQEFSRTNQSRITRAYTSLN